VKLRVVICLNLQSTSPQRLAYFGAWITASNTLNGSPAMVGNHVADIVGKKYGADSGLVPKS